MLDEIHDDLPTLPLDNNIYTLGTMGSHNVVISCCPPGLYGTKSAATVAIQMISTFHSIRFRLMVGIGSGVPNKQADIRPGDVVVSIPTAYYGGVVQFDHGKTTIEAQSATSILNKPPQVLLKAVAIVINPVIKRMCVLRMTTKATWQIVRTDGDLARFLEFPLVWSLCMKYSIKF
jgi:nucleoside phosphorylase